jgi:hypothetical protein
LPAPQFLGNVVLARRITEPPSHSFKDRISGCFLEDDFGIASHEHIGVDQIKVVRQNAIRLFGLPHGL